MQRGFVPGRQQVHNVIDLINYRQKHVSECYGQIVFESQDSLAKCLRWCLEALPLSVLSDFAAAFPSVAHRWIWALVV